MEAGQMRHRVTIERPTRTESEVSGGVTLAWAAVREVSARVRPLSAREQAQQSRPGHEVSHEVTLRYAADVTPDCRLVYRGRVLNIESLVNVEERNRELRITARETTTVGA